MIKLNSPPHILLSKTNRLGDVLMAFPVATRLKQCYPDARITFLGNGYTRYLVESCPDIDAFWDWSELAKQTDRELEQTFRQANFAAIMHLRPQRRIAKLAKQARIPLRIGTLHRAYHWLNCNKLVAINRNGFKAKRHEAQLDWLHLKPLGEKTCPSLDALSAMYTFKPWQQPAACLNLLDSERFNLIIHPKSATNAGSREWPTTNYAQLIQRLDPQRYKIFITGTAAEGDLVRQQLIEPFSEVVDLCGQLNIDELQQFIAHSDGLIACSTGPLHIAATRGIRTLGLYAPILDHSPQRWGPLGQHAQVLCYEKSCNACHKSGPCPCIEQIHLAQVLKVIQGWGA